MIGCDCAVCSSEDPKNTRYRSHAHVQMGGLDIQIDAAPEFRIQAIKYRIPKVDIAILTHGHADHILGFDDLRRYCDQRDGDAIPVYSTQEGLDRLQAIYPYAIRERPAIRGYPAFSPKLMPRRLDLEPHGVIHSTLQAHGPLQTLGLVFEETGTGKRLAYYTDCAGITPEAANLARGADIAVLDGLRSQEHPSHMNTVQACAAAAEIGAQRSYLIHMTHEIDHEVAEKQLPENVYYSYDGLRLEV